MWIPLVIKLGVLLYSVLCGFRPKFGTLLADRKELLKINLFFYVKVCYVHVSNIVSCS